MKKLLLGIILLASAMVVPAPGMAEVNIYVQIPLPPPIVFPAPPEVIVIPDTHYVYVVPDIEVDIFFWGGWWWRLWEGRWYRTHYYDRGWTYYNYVPSFYFDIDPGWRRYYRDQNWYGHRWSYDRIPHQRLQQNWKRWRDDRYWERQRTWGVQGYQPRPQQQRQELRHQRQEQYQQRPDVQQHRRQMQQLQRQPPVQRPQQQQQQPRVQRPQQQQRQPQVQRPQQQQQQPQVQRKEEGKTIRPQGGPAGQGERQQVQPRKKRKPAGTEGEPESKDERRPER